MDYLHSKFQCQARARRPPIDSFSTISTISTIYPSTALPSVQSPCPRARAKHQVQFTEMPPSPKGWPHSLRTHLSLNMRFQAPVCPSVPARIKPSAVLYTRIDPLPAALGLHNASPRCSSHSWSRSERFCNGSSAR